MQVRQTMQGMRSSQPMCVRSRRSTVRVQAKVNKQEGSPRIVRGKCFVTRDVSFLVYSTEMVLKASTIHAGETVCTFWN